MKISTFTRSGNLYFLFILNLIVAQLQAQDFKVQHLEHDISNPYSTTQSIDPVSSLNNAFVLANNNRKVNAGYSNLTGSDLDGRDLAGARRLENTDYITYYRETNSQNSDMRFSSSIWEYTGPAGGPNEFIVRGRYIAWLGDTYNSTQIWLTNDTNDPNYITNNNKCIPFITGIMNSDDSDGADSGTAMAYLDTAWGNNIITVNKGSNANTVAVYITLVEFTGSNWTLAYGDSGNVDSDTGTIELKSNANGTGNTVNVTDWDETVIFSHHIGNPSDNGVNQAIADNWPIFEPGNNKHRVDWEFDSNHDSQSSGNRHFVHVLSNPDMKVTRFSDNNSSTGEQTVDITSAGLSNIDKALIVGTSISSGGGTAYGRGWRNYYLKSTTEAAHWSHRSGNTMTHEIQVIDLSNLFAVDGPEIEVTGNGTSIDNGDNTPSPIDHTDFGSIDLGNSLSFAFTINNIGNEDLDIDNISLSNTLNFSISATPASYTVTSGDSTTFTITYTANTVGTDTCIVTITNDDSDENPFEFTIQAIGEQTFYDSDGDGIFDNIDIDDDNDGILDSEEENNCKNSSISITANYKFLNETFGTGDRTTINTTYDAITTYCYEDGSSTVDTTECPYNSSTDLNDGQYTVYYKACNGDGTNQTPTEELASWADEHWYTGVDHTPNDNQGRMAMFNASYDPGVFYTANITGALPGIPISYSFWVLNLDRTDAPGIDSRLRPNILVEFRDTDDNLLASITTGDIPPTTQGNLSGDWYNFSANLTFNVSEFNVYFFNNETGGLGNDLALDDIEISQTLCDTDSDGVADIFDLDSDNDGIPDVVENGLGTLSDGTATLSYTSGWIDANGNGMHDLAETNIPLDTDGDGVPNYLDLDSDNDSIFDVDESGAGNSGDTNFQNGDGDINGDGVGDGTDTDYIREKDFNSDGELEYFADGILDIFDFHNGSNYPAAYGNSNQGLGYTNFVTDTDSDGIPDYMDTDSNNDGIYDIANTLYAYLDANNNGVIDDTNDTDGDGIVDLFDTDDSLFGSPRDLDDKLHLYFDGRNDYAQDTNIIDNWSSATMMGWIKIDPASTGAQIIMGQSSFQLGIDPNKYLFAIANSDLIISPDSLATNQWIHVGATYSSSGIFRLYLNGMEIATNNSAYNNLTDTSNFTLGRSPNSSNSFFHGYMDEIRLFDKALSDDEIHKMVYQEILNNSGTIRGKIIPRNITDFVNTTNNQPLPWDRLIRYFRMDTYKDDIIDDFSTPTTDEGDGDFARIYNMKTIDIQSAPMPFITQQSGSLPDALNILEDGVNGEDAITYDWSIVQVKHNNITWNASQKHLGLFVDALDTNSNPIEFDVEDDSELNVSWYLKLDGTINLEGQSQLVQGLDSELAVTSVGKLKRDQQGTADTYTYNYWSSPVGAASTSSNNTSYKVTDVMYDGTQPINFSTSGYNGANTSPITIADYWIWKFANQLDDDYSSWQHIRKTGTIYAGEGFTMKGPGSGSILDEQNYTFIGKPNNGDINLTLNAGNDYLVGNPYPSAIDAYQFIEDNGAVIAGTAPTITGTLYFWEHWGGGSHILAEYQGGYATYNLAGGVPAASYGTNDPDVGTGGTPVKLPGRYIPVAQGFFVVAEGAGGTINFNNGQRVFEKEDGTYNGSSVFMRSAQTTNSDNTTTNTESSNYDDRMRLRIGFNSVNTIRRQLLLTVDENASLEEDWGYDGKMNLLQMDDLFWIINDNKFVIQGTDIANESTAFPLGILTDTQGFNSIVLDSVENAPEDTVVYIHDKVLNTYHNISDSAFEFFLPAGELLDRFELTFTTNDDTLGMNENNLNSLQIFYSNKKEHLVLLNPDLITVESMELFNLLGQSILYLDDIHPNRHSEYGVEDLSSGTYIIQISTTKGTTSKKVIIN